MLNDTKGASDDALPSKEGPIGRVTSTSEAQIIDIEDSRNGEFQRSFSPRQVHASVFLQTKLRVNQ